MRRVLVRSEMCVACRSCEIACINQHLGDGEREPGSRPLAVPRLKVECRLLDRTSRPADDAGTMGPQGNLRKVHVILCQHCDEPECVGACTAGALTKDPDGLVRHHPELCVGCMECMASCPYDAIHQDPSGKTVVKCDLCGGKEIPSCIEACTVGALYLEAEPSGDI